MVFGASPSALPVWVFSDLLSITSASMPNRIRLQLCMIQQCETHSPQLVGAVVLTLTSGLLVRRLPPRHRCRQGAECLVVLFFAGGDMNVGGFDF